ncbi:MAG: WYL domain-containing protein [Polyangiales bacterium]
MNTLPRLPPANDTAPRGDLTRMDPALRDRVVRVRVTQAITERRVCRALYRSEPGGAPALREIEPLHLVFVDDHWSILAWCHLRKDLRSFRSDRLDVLEVTDQHFSPRKGLSIERFILARKRSMR